VFASYLSIWQGGFGTLHDGIIPQKQSFWDRTGILSYLSAVKSSIQDPEQMVQFLAASAPHSGDWLLSLTIAACGLRLSDDAVRVAVSMRLAAAFVSPTRADVEPQWTHTGSML